MNKLKELFTPRPDMEEADYIKYLEKENKHLTELKDEAIKLHNKSKEELRFIKSEIMKARTIKGLKEKVGIN